MSDNNREPVAPRAMEAPRKRRPRELMQDFIDDNSETSREFGLLEMLTKTKVSVRCVEQLVQAILEETARVRREKLYLERVLKSRTAERNGANNAHKLRLQQYWDTLAELVKAHTALEQQRTLLAKRDEQIAKLKGELATLQAKRATSVAVFPPAQKVIES